MATVTVSKANLNVFFVLLGPAPFFVASLFCFVAKRKSGWGICGSFLVVVVLLLFVCRDDLPKFLDHTCPCTFLLFTAYAIVRTEPSANRPNRREKKNPMHISISNMTRRMSRLSLSVSGLKSMKSSRLFKVIFTLVRGNAWKAGTYGNMEIYTRVHMDCMCYVSGCNLHGGYNKMLLMVYLGRTLKLMQNGLRTTGIGYNTVKMRFMCM